jgi:UDP-N-acetylmuramate dehydrogenase
LEHIVGIPGTLGGLIVMNGGSRRKAIGEVVVTVTAMDREGSVRVFRQDECAFSYRHSRFQDEGLAVTEVTMELTAGRPGDILAEMREILRQRRKKFPLNMPNCGSVFKSTPGSYDKFGPPGQIVEGLGLKGLRVGDAMVDTKHANFIVNLGSAAAGDVIRLVSTVREAVHRMLGIDMECEVRYVDCRGRCRTLSSELP